MHDNNILKTKEGNILKLPSFEEKMNKIISNPKASLIVIADYDDTFTKAYVNNTRSRTSFGVIDTSSNISFDYTSRAKALGDECRVYENDSSIDFEKRKEIMSYWYNSGLTLMVNEKISKDLLSKMINEAVDEKHVKFREGTEEFFKLLITHRIPLIIISAGIKQVIEGEFKLFTKHYDTLMEKELLHIIANEFIFNEDCVADYHKPPILTFNKMEFLNNELALLSLNESRNIIFLGDHLNDIDSIKDIKYDTVLSFAFYNVLKAKAPQEYCDKYDAVIENDGDFFAINEVISKIKHQ